MKALHFLAPFALASLAIASDGCVLVPRTEWKVSVVTDAPSPAWVDRALLEVVVDDGSLACDGCRHEVLNLTAASFPLTFAVAPTSVVNGPNIHVRARLFRSADVKPDGSPPDAAVIDAIGTLPLLNTQAGGFGGVQATPAAMDLFAGCFGQSVVFAKTIQSCAPTDAGTFARADEQELPGADYYNLTPGNSTAAQVADAYCDNPPEGEVCVPGDPFLLGETRYLGVDTDYPPAPEVPELLSDTFFVDADEMTVGTVRHLIAEKKISTSGIQTKGGAGVSAACTFLGATDATNDALSINCITLDAAELVCFALNESLPPEDVWEHAARGDVESLFPWGDEPPTCATAIVSADATCVRTGPVAGGSPLDVTARGIRNLGGNLSEWVDGPLLLYSDPCWTAGTCSTDPKYLSWKGPWPHRGGSFASPASGAATFARFASADGSASDEIGFRCATLSETSSQP